LLRCELIPDGEVVETKDGKIATFLGLDGETISINSIKQKDDLQEEEDEPSAQEDEIKHLLEKIKL
jgi:hypothetical protein